MELKLIFIERCKKRLDRVGQKGEVWWEKRGRERKEDKREGGGERKKKEMKEGEGGRREGDWWRC